MVCELYLSKVTTKKKKIGLKSIEYFPCCGWDLLNSSLTRDLIRALCKESAES